MSMRTTIVAALEAWAGRYEDDLAPGTPEQMADAYRAEVRRETQLEDADQIEAWQHDADDAAAYHHGALTDTETAAHVAVHRAAKGLRDIAAGTQPPAAPDFFQPGHTYAHTHYRFHCLHLVTHPVTGEVHAWGWFGKADSDGRRHMSFGRGLWDARPWDDTTTTAVPASPRTPAPRPPQS